MPGYIRLRWKRKAATNTLAFYYIAIVLQNLKCFSPKRFLGNIAILQQARAFDTAVHFHPSLIFTGKARSLPLEWGSIRGSTSVGYSLAHTITTRPVVNGSDKHSSLLLYGNNYSRKTINNIGPAAVECIIKLIHL